MLEKMIEEVLNTNAREKGSSNQGGFKKLDIIIPTNLMGHVIGKGRENLSKLETKTGVALKVNDNSLYIKGSTEKQKKATREIKAIVTRSQLEDNHEFEPVHRTATKCQLGRRKFLNLNYWSILLQEETSSGFGCERNLKRKGLRGVEANSQRKGRGDVKSGHVVSFRGHAYITKIDEDEEEETFTLQDIKQKIETNDGNSGKPFFQRRRREDGS
ncbi:hypothetical protein OS493_030873 [Desmophyllum pertusum]|uniref:K Homology domain-containing protein n=1 Tax=Desmophyllum pertusum TaxID=174260 RepID=A0A9X0CEF2_9CNID|nr:hypothetical protein OS493_030873 [Desmophyllum pertusum]